MADFFEWDAATLELKVAPMDAEHLKLIKLMNRVHAAYAKSPSSPALRPALKELVDFTNEHFRHEEAYLTRISYPGLTKHQIIHASLLEKLNKHVETYEQTRQIKPELFSFLKFWLQSHIMGIDKQYATFSKGKALA